MVMKSSDILYVPDSAGKKVLVKGAEAAVGVGSGIAIYRSASTRNGKDERMSDFVTRRVN